MTAKLINGVVKDFQVGDRVVWDKAGNSIYEVIKVSGIGTTINLFGYAPQKGSLHPKAKQRVLLNEIEPLHIGSNDRHHAKSSRGFAVGNRVKDGCSFDTIKSQNSEEVNISWETNNCSPHSTSSFVARWQVYQELEKCSYNSISVAGSAQDFRLQDSSPEDSSLKDYAKSINSVMTDCAIASLKSLSTLTCDRYSSTLKSSKSSLVVRHASPFPLKVNVEVQQISATVSPPCCIPSNQYNL